MLDMTDTIFNVDSTALFYARPSPDIGALLTDLNARFADREGCHLTVSALSHADWWLLACDHFHIMVTFADRPDTSPAVAEAALAPITTVRRFDYGQAVQSHTAHLRIEVGDGNAPLPPEARVIMQEFGSAKVCDAALKMRALHWTSQFIARNPGFLALYFGPSERIFCPEELEAAGDTPDRLLRHPVPTLPEPGPTGQDGYGLRLRNPQHLGAPAIELEGIPVSVPLATAVSLLDTLLNARAKGKMTPVHGKVLQPSAKLALYTREELPCEEAPLGRFVLSFWKDRGHDAPRPTAQAVPKPAPVPIVAPEPVAPPAPSIEPQMAPVEPEPQLASLTPTPVTEEEPMMVPVAGALTEPEELDAEEPQTEEIEMRGPGLLARLFPLDLRLKLTGIAAVLAVALVANPYVGFTGGMTVSQQPAVEVAATLVGDARAFVETVVLPRFR